MLPELSVGTAPLCISTASRSSSSARAGQQYALKPGAAVPSPRDALLEMLTSRRTAQQTRPDTHHERLRPGTDSPLALQALRAELQPCPERSGRAPQTFAKDIVGAARASSENPMESADDSGPRLHRPPMTNESTAAAGEPSPETAAGCSTSPNLPPWRQPSHHASPRAASYSASVQARAALSVFEHDASSARDSAKLARGPGVQEAPAAQKTVAVIGVSSDESVPHCNYRFKVNGSRTSRLRFEAWVRSPLAMRQGVSDCASRARGVTSSAPNTPRPAGRSPRTTLVQNAEAMPRCSDAKLAVVPLRMLAASLATRLELTVGTKDRHVELPPAELPRGFVAHVAKRRHDMHLPPEVAWLAGPAGTSGVPVGFGSRRKPI